MSVYRPTSPSAKSPSVDAPIILNWDHERKVWAQIHAQATERYQQYQLEMGKDQNREKSRSILCQQQEAQEKAQAETEKEKAEQTSSLACYKRVWWASVFGLILSGTFFLVLFTNLLRDTQASRLGTKTRCDLLPSLTDVSKISVMFWTAVTVDILSRSVEVMAVLNVAMLSETLLRDDRAHWQRLYEYSRFGNYAGAAMASIPLLWVFFLTVRGKCDGHVCLDLGFATLAVLTWTLLASIVAARILKSWYRAKAGQ